ncbi:MAG: hypothetical protein AB1611_20015 [bacterium]
MMMRISQAVGKPLCALICFLLCIGSFQACGEKNTVAPPSENLLTVSCDPCRFKIAQRLDPFAVRFKLKNLPDDRRVVESLQVSRDDKPGWTQVLAVHDMTPVGKNDEVFIGTADINFDGYNDLLFATSLGTANTYADYWLYVPSKQEFDYLGNYPVFTVDSGKHRLSTYERGGHGGMIYQANHYNFVNGVLKLVESEKQVATDQEGVYQKSIFQLKNGKLSLIKKETIKAPPQK